MLSDFQNEGITTYMAYKAQAFFPAKYENDYNLLENKDTVFELLSNLNTLFKNAVSIAVDQLQKKSWELGVEERGYYVVGAYMAQIIDEKKGRDELIETILKGPITFIRTYNALVDKNKQIYELEPPANPLIFEQLRQAAVNEDYRKYRQIFNELGCMKSSIDQLTLDKFLKIGRVFIQRKRNDLAIKIFQFSVELFPESAAAYNFLGKAFMHKDDSENALINFQKAVELDPEYVDAFENLKKLNQVNHK
jgi:tetratricopeptide (TPR) repeat protein